MVRSRRSRETSCTCPPCSAPWWSRTIFRVSAPRRSGSTAISLPASSSVRSPGGTTGESRRSIPGSSCPGRTSSSSTARMDRGRRSSSRTTCRKCRRPGRARSGALPPLNWPVGLGGKGNEGVTQQVKQSEGAIGYVELIYALSNHLPAALLRNASGNFVEASIKRVTAAAASAKSRLRHRLPGVDHQRARSGLVPDLVVHLAAGPSRRRRQRQGGRDSRLPPLDARARGAAHGGRPRVRAPPGPPHRAGSSICSRTRDTSVTQP